MEEMYLRVCYGEVQFDTHNAYGKKIIADTKTARKLHPNAEVIDEGLEISDPNVGIFTAPISGVYKVYHIVNTPLTTDSNVYNVCLSVGEEIQIDKRTIMTISRVE